MLKTTQTRHLFFNFIILINRKITIKYSFAKVKQIGQLFVIAI